MDASSVVRRLALAGLLFFAARPGDAAAQYGRRIASFNVASQMDEATGWDRDYAVTFPLAEDRYGALFFSCGDQPGRYVAGFRLRTPGAEGAVRRVAWSLNGAPLDSLTLRGTGNHIWLVDDAQVDAFAGSAQTMERMSMSVPADSAARRVEYVIFFPGASVALPGLKCDQAPESPGVPSGRATLLALAREPFLRDDGKLGSDPPAPGWQPRITNMGEVMRVLSRGYPANLNDAGVSGAVHLRVRVLADGSAELASARVVYAEHQEFVETALRALAAMRFQPAVRDGQPASVWVTIPIEFRTPA